MGIAAGHSSHHTEPAPGHTTDVTSSAPCAQEAGVAIQATKGQQVHQSQGSPFFSGPACVGPSIRGSGGTDFSAPASAEEGQRNWGPPIIHVPVCAPK